MEDWLKKGGQLHGGGDLKVSLNSRWLGWSGGSMGTAGLCLCSEEQSLVQRPPSWGSVRRMQGRPLWMVMGLRPGGSGMV